MQFNDLGLHDELLGIAFVGRNDPYRPLAEHIAELVGDIELLTIGLHALS